MFTIASKMYIFFFMENLNFLIYFNVFCFLIFNCTYCWINNIFILDIQAWIHGWRSHLLKIRQEFEPLCLMIDNFLHFMFMKMIYDKFKVFERKKYFNCHDSIWIVQIFVQTLLKLTGISQEIFLNVIEFNLTE